MKSVKIILGIVIAFTVVFLATGLVVQEVKYTTEIEINKPIDKVFSAFENPEMLKKWIPEIKSIEPLEEKVNKVGSIYKMVIENQGQEIEMQEKITEYILNKKITFHFDSKEMFKIDAYNFIIEGNNTKIIQHSSIQSKSYIMSCLFPYFKGTFKQVSQGYLEKFKKFIEK